MDHQWTNDSTCKSGSESPTVITLTSDEFQQRGSNSPLLKRSMTVRPIFPDGFLCVSKLGTQKNAPALDHIPFRMAVSFRFLPHVRIKPRRAMVFYGILWDFGTFHRPSKHCRERFHWDPWVNIDETPSIPGHPRGQLRSLLVNIWTHHPVVHHHSMCRDYDEWLHLVVSPHGLCVSSRFKLVFVLAILLVVSLILDLCQSLHQFGPWSSWT